MEAIIAILALVAGLHGAVVHKSAEMEKCLETSPVGAFGAFSYTVTPFTDVDALCKQISQPEGGK